MRGSSGYAIAEVLVACVIISISFVELSRAISNIMRSANQTVLMGKSISVAHSTMEEVMAQSFDAKGSEAGGYVLEFDGDDDYVDTETTFQPTFTSSFTISCWIMAVDGQPSSIQCVLGSQGPSDQNCVRLEINTDGKIHFHYEANGDDKTAITSSAIFSDGATDWTHIVCVADDDENELLIYVNGESQTVTDNNVSGVTFGNWTSTADFFIGARDQGATANRFFEGRMDEVRIWNDVRTADEILASYNRNISDPYDESSLKLYLRMNNGSGSIAFDHSSSMEHGTLKNMDDADWVTDYSTSLSKETGETSDWSSFDDVDDFHKSGGFTDSDYSQLGGRIYVKYVVVDPTSWAISDAGENVITDYKQITVKIGIPGSTDSTQLNAIKSAKIIQNYELTYSPYGVLP